MTPSFSTVVLLISRGRSSSGSRIPSCDSDRLNVTAGFPGDLTEMRPSSVGFCAHAAGWRQATARITADTDFVISFMFSEKNEYFSNACGFRTFFGKGIEYNRNFSGNLDYLT